VKLCYNCFHEIGEEDKRCDPCGVIISYETHSPHVLETFVEPEKDYGPEYDKLEELNLQESYEESIRYRSIQSDLPVVMFALAFLSLIQIYTSFVVDKINIVSPVIGMGPLISGDFLRVSGILYFAGIVLFYLSFYRSRLLFMVLNLTHIMILYLVYLKLQVIASVNASDFPEAIQNFLASVPMLKWLVLVFGVMYFIQTLSMFRKELVDSVQSLLS